MHLLRLALVAAVAAEAPRTTTTKTNTDGPTPSKALTAPATSAAVSPALVSKNLGAAAAGERQQGRLALSLEVAWWWPD